MLKALTGLLVAGAAALAIASPAAAAPVCSNGTATAYSSQYATYGWVELDIYDFCTGDDLFITEVRDIPPSDWSYVSPTVISYDQVYYQTGNYVTFDVSDGTNSTSFTVIVDRAYN